MSSVGTWRAPLPLRVGGGGHRTVTQVYDKINASIGTAIAHEDGTYQDMQTKAEARAVALIHRATDRRFNQADPTKLSTLLERWETILKIVPGPDDTQWTRRRRVAARLRRDNSALPAGILSLCEQAFSPWAVTIETVAKESTGVRLTWTGTTPASTAAITATNFWTSNIGHFVVQYFRPASATEEDVTTRRSACLDALYEFAAVWTTFSLTETPAYGPVGSANVMGFFLDRPNIGRTVFAPL